MRILLALVLALAAVPASAETFRFERAVSLPAIDKPTDVSIELSPTIQAEGGFRIVTQTGFAIPFLTDEMSRDLMYRARIVASPAAADTVPRTNAEMIRNAGSFQPMTAESHTFLFSFPEDITPVELALSLESGRIESVRVRGGLSQDAMKNLFAGPAVGGAYVSLSGERVRFVEVTIRSSGVLKIESIRLFDRPDVLLFRANPGKTYVLLSGANDAAQVRFPYGDNSYVYDPALSATLGASRAPTMPGDHDGIADASDNCPQHWNRGQEDGDKDGFGDACDPCPTVANGEDADKNGYCDGLEDVDEDGVIALRDNCPIVPNRLQEDEDADGIGNACDDSDDRFSSDKPWLLWAGIAVMILALMGVAALALRKKS